MDYQDRVRQSTTWWYTGYILVDPQQGWQCPCCKTVYSPWVGKCECEKVSTTITYTYSNQTDGWPKEEEDENIGTAV
jgi:hypothetical protein